jgi:hypothetical protein
MWLDEPDIERLTGTKRPAVQCKRLQKMGLAFIRSATGKPLVERDTLSKEDDRDKPNFKALNALTRAGKNVLEERRLLLGVAGKQVAQAGRNAR